MIHLFPVTNNPSYGAAIRVIKINDLIMTVGYVISASNNTAPTNVLLHGN